MIPKDFRFGSNDQTFPLRAFFVLEKISPIHALFAKREVGNCAMEAFHSGL
ncbi:MAG: hypothetical protein PHW87_12240 [Methanothrix sp.]|nr:hypothetical protein [Methanothrix sp.]